MTSEEKEALLATLSVIFGDLRQLRIKLDALAHALGQTDANFQLDYQRGLAESGKHVLDDPGTTLEYLRKILGTNTQYDLPPISQPLITGVSRFWFGFEINSQPPSRLCKCGKRSLLSTFA